MSSQPANSFKNTVLSLLLLITTIGIVLFIAEFVLRQLGKDDSVNLKEGFYKVEGNWYKRRVSPYDIALMPNGVASVQSTEFRIQHFFNSLGYRDYEFTRKKAENTYRIVVVGDSLTFGAGVELDRVFSKQLERKFKAVFSKNIEVLNLGVGAASAGQNYLRTLKDGLDLEADLIVLVTYANDAMEWPHYINTETGLPKSYLVSQDHWDKTKATGREKIIQFEPIAPPGFLIQASQWSELANLVLKVWNIKLNPPKTSAGGSYNFGDPWLDPFWPLRENTNYSQMQEWKYHLKILQATAQGVVQNGKGFLAVILPPGHVVNDFEWDIGRQYHSFAAGFTHNDAPLRDIYDSFQDIDVPVIYLKGAMAQTSKQEDRLYFPYDGHLTPRGHDVVATTLFNKIQGLTHLKIIDK